jgi:hypothetical protein
MQQTYESGALWVLLTAPLLPDFLDRRGGGGGGGSALLFNQGGELLFQLLSFRSPECTPHCCGSELVSMRILIQLFISMRIRIQGTNLMRIHADLDPGQSLK